MKTSQGTLFVIDDDSKSRKAVAALASSLKIKCKAFASAEEFLDRCDSSLIGCALIDFRLPGMNGLQLQERLRDMDSLLSVVLVSAYADVSLAVRAMKNGAIAVIEKPYRSDDLVSTVVEAMEHSDCSRQPFAQHTDDCRQRLFAHDLHDGAAQYLVTAIMYMENYQHCQNLCTEEARIAFQDGMQFLRRSLKELRSFICGTYVATTAASIVGALEDVVAQFRDRLDVELIHDPQLVQPGTQLIGAIYRMVQESLTNAWRHSGNRKVRIEVRQDDGELCVDVRDWGMGFDVEKVDRGRFGLQGIRERARLFGGEASVASAPGEGTCVSIRVPISPPTSQESAAVALSDRLLPLLPCS
jgi:signal transduction histidine kinase